MKFNKISIMVLLLGMLLLFSACESTDLVAKVAITSFGALTKAIPDNIAFDDAKGGWAINGLDGKERIILSSDFSSGNPDMAVEFDAAPFVDAGLDVSKLPAGQYLYDKSTGKITMPYEYGRDKFGDSSSKFGDSSSKSALETFKQIVKTHRSIIGYHEQGDHYMVTLDPNYNLFAWAKDMSTNKIDLAFALSPKPFVDAGVDTGKLKEWVFAKLPITDKDGKTVQIDVFLKGFNIE